VLPPRKAEPRLRRPRRARSTRCARSAVRGSGRQRRGATASQPCRAVRARSRRVVPRGTGRFGTSRALGEAGRKDTGFSPLTLAWTVRQLPLQLAPALGFDQELLRAFSDDLVRRL